MYKKIILSLLTMAGLEGALAQDLNLNSPTYIPPKCGFNVDPGDLRVFYSEDCATIHLAPPINREPLTDFKIINTYHCDNYRENYEVLTLQTQNIKTLYEKQRALIDAENFEEASFLNGLIEEAADLQKTSQKALAELNENVTVQANSYFEGQITNADIATFQFKNLNALWGLPVDVRTLRTHNSMYSYTFRDLGGEDSNQRAIIESELPGLMALQQVNGPETSTVHTSFNGNVSGVTKFGATACRHIKKDDEGNEYIDEEGMSSIMTVNRSYDVNLKAVRGYSAKLNVDLVTQQMATELLTATESGFSKAQFFDKTMSTHGEEVVTIEFYEDYPFSEEREMEEEKIRQYLFERYYKILEERNLLASAEPSLVEPSEGGYIDITKSRRVCWRSGIFRKKRCKNETYKVPKWVDGQNLKVIRDKIKIDVAIESHVKTNQMVPYSLGTTFFPLSKVKKFSKVGVLK